MLFDQRTLKQSFDMLYSQASLVQTILSPVPFNSDKKPVNETLNDCLCICVNLFQEIQTNSCSSSYSFDSGFVSFIFSTQKRS